MILLSAFQPYILFMQVPMFLKVCFQRSRQYLIISMNSINEPMP